MKIVTEPLYLNAVDFHLLLKHLGPSLGLWRAAEIAVLREQEYLHPILDLGCGDGSVTAMFLKHVDVGMDPEPGILDRAGQRNIYQSLEPISVENSNYPEGSFSTILSNSVFEHITDLEAVLTASGRLLQPGGRLIFTSPTEAFPRWLALPLSRYAKWRNRSLIHINLFSLAQWNTRLTQAGFEIRLVRPYLSRRLVWLWDFLDLLQMIWIGRTRLFGAAWKRLPPSWLERFAGLAARTNLAASEPGGGRLIVARRMR